MDRRHVLVVFVRLFGFSRFWVLFLSSLLVVEGAEAVDSTVEEAPRLGLGLLRTSGGASCSIN